MRPQQPFFSRKSWTKRISKKIFLSLGVLLIGLGLISFGTWNYLLDAPSSDTTPVLFVIEPGEHLSSIIDRLNAGGFLRHALATKVYLRVNNLEKSIQAGEFTLHHAMDVPTLLKTLSRGFLDQKVTIVEGLRVEEIAALLHDKLGVDKDEFLKNAEEGYMFPDTYEFAASTSARDIAARLRTTFEERYEQILKTSGNHSGLTKEQVVTLASIVERESVGIDDESALIAGILLKRYQEGMPLEADATVQYALGYNQKEKTWWTKNIFEEELSIDSPYNTRKRIGLPPGPIASPGLESLQAVLNPKNSSYWFYIHDGDGRVHYARTLEEHNRNVATYLQ